MILAETLAFKLPMKSLTRLFWSRFKPDPNHPQTKPLALKTASSSCCHGIPPVRIACLFPAHYSCSHGIHLVAQCKLKSVLLHRMSTLGLNWSSKPHCVYSLTMKLEEIRPQGKHLRRKQCGLICGAIEESSRMEILTLKKCVNRDKCVFRDKTAYVWGLRYQWDLSLSRNLIPRFPHIKPPWPELIVQMFFPFNIINGRPRDLGIRLGRVGLFQNRVG